VTNTSTITAVS